MCTINNVIISVDSNGTQPFVCMYPFSPKLIPSRLTLGFILNNHFSFVCVC